MFGPNCADKHIFVGGFFRFVQPAVVDNSQTQTEKKFKTTVDIDNLLLKNKSVDTKEFELM